MHGYGRGNDTPGGLTLAPTPITVITSGRRYPQTRCRTTRLPARGPDGPAGCCGSGDGCSPSRSSRPRQGRRRQRTPSGTSTSTSGGPGSWLRFPSASPGLVLPLGWRRLVAAYGVAISRARGPGLVPVQTAPLLPDGVAGFAAGRHGRQGGRPARSRATLAIELGLLAAWAGLFAAVFIPRPSCRRPDGCFSGSAQRSRSARCRRSSRSAEGCSPAYPRSHHTSWIGGRCTRRRSSTGSTQR